MHFRGLGVTAVATMSLGMVAGADTTSSTYSRTSVTSASSSKCTPHTELKDNTVMVVGCETATTETTLTQGSATGMGGFPATLTASSTETSAEVSFTRSTTTIPTASPLPPPTSSQSTTSLQMASPGPEQPHSDLSTSSASQESPVPASSNSVVIFPSTTITVLPLPSQLSTEIPSLSRPVPTNLSPLSCSCPLCESKVVPKTVSIECINGALPVPPPKAPSPCNCPSDMTKTACYGPHPMIPASSKRTSTYSVIGGGPYTFANGTVSMIHSTGTASAVSAAFPAAAVPKSSKSHSTLYLTSMVTSRSTTYVTPPSSSSTISRLSHDVPVIIPTISTKSKTSAPCAAVTVTVTTTTVSILTKFETVVEGTYAISRQEAHTVGSQSVPVLGHQRTKSWLAMQNTPSQFAGVPQPTSSTKRQGPSPIPRPISPGAPGPVVGNPTFLNGVDGVNGGSITTSTPEALPATVTRSLGDENDGAPASSSTQYTRGSGDNDGGFPFIVSRRPHATSNNWITKTGVAQAPTNVSHNVPAASSGRLLMAPNNGTVPMGTGLPHLPSYPHSRPTRSPETEMKTMA